MKNKLTFRILGALASALIIVSMFIPFISVGICFLGTTTSSVITFPLSFEVAPNAALLAVQKICSCSFVKNKDKSIYLVFY